VDKVEILGALGLGPDTPAEWEPVGEMSGSPVRLFVPGEPPSEYLVREPADAEAAANQLAVSEALLRAEYPFMPRVCGISGQALIEEAVPGASALQLVPPAGSAEAAIHALAALHALPLREGLDWGRSPLDLFPPVEAPLHRLGFSSAEREPALAPLSEAEDHLRASAFGFAHRDCTAANVLLAPGRAWLCDFSAAGFGPRLFDVAGFLLTSGIEAAGRRALAAAYAKEAGLAADDTADEVDLLGIVWGIRWLLELPRKLITSLGDDVMTEGLKLAAGRVERGIRQPAGDSPVAAAIRAALWPARA